MATTNQGLLKPMSLDQALNKMPKAQQSNVTEDMTSAGRLDKMLSQDSPLMKRARTQGAQYSNSRGLLNSSMGAEASTGAMIDRAQPFAMQDSQSLIQNQQFNTDARNQRGLLQSGLIGDSYKSNQNYAQQMGLNEQAYGFERGLNKQQFGFQTQRDDTLNQYGRDMARLDAELREAQAQGDFGREQELMAQQADLTAQRDQALAGYEEDMARLGSELTAQRDEAQFGYEQDLTEQQSELQLERDRLLNEQQVSRDERLASFDQDMQRLNAELQEAQAGNDFQRTQQLEEQRAELQSERDQTLFSYDMQNTERQADIQAARDQRLSELDADSARLQQELQEAQAQNDFGRTEQLTERQAEIQEARDKLTFAQKMESMAEEYGLRDELAQSEAERAMKEMFAASTGNAWGVMNNNVTDLVGQASSEIQNVQMNPNISPEDKTTMIDDILSRRDTDLEFQQSLYQGLSNSLMSTGAFQGSGVFDEGAYLAANPDVAAEVEQGLLPSGLAHYQQYGIREGRNMEGA